MTDGGGRGAHLAPGQKVTIIKKLADRLVDMDDDEMDLTLRQFGFDWSPGWNGSRENYATVMLERGSDQGLLDLEDYLFPEKEPQNAVQGNWAQGTFRLFISHTSSHRVNVAALSGALRYQFGIEGFVAHNDIEPAAEWVNAIEAALDTCHAIAAYLTTDFHASSWTDQEIGYCLRRRVLVVPLRIDGNPYGFFARYQALPINGLSPDQAAQSIFDVLIDSDLTAGTMASALVNFFVNSETYKGARRTSQLLSRVKVWTPEMLRSLEESIEQNDQIRDAIGVPGRIQALIKAHRG